MDVLINQKLFKLMLIQSIFQYKMSILPAQSFHRICTVLHHIQNHINKENTRKTVNFLSTATRKSLMKPIEQNSQLVKRNDECWLSSKKKINIEISYKLKYQETVQPCLQLSQILKIIHTHTCTIEGKID